MKITTTAFTEGAWIPVQFTCDGDDAPPIFGVSDLPSGARSLALIMDDPDAPNGIFTHWLVYDMPAREGPLEAGHGKTLTNGFGRQGYGGPCPPQGHGPHRYYFTLYAVDVPSLPLQGKDRQDLEEALGAHTLGAAKLMGRYERAKKK
jgi:Raf kinase inhibitor-like YbhB/YbcL family protein